MIDDTYFRLRPPAPTPEDEICSCVDGKPIKLMCALTYNPVHCIDCNLEILPKSLGLDATFAEAVAKWGSVYDALDRLWLDSGEYESWAKAELENVCSSVNQRGREVAAQLNAIRRCYYWLFQDQSTPDFEPIRVCPACTRELRLYEGGVFRQLICDSCSIVTAWG
jgi:predicted  nucleic acid-binding Zn ribbon protein